MRKLLLAAGIVLITFTSRRIAVDAGSLNSYENEVISAAKLVYEYDGVKYQVDQTFINQLTDYLSSDGIDLTADQRDEVLQLAFSNIEQGVNEGYLLPVNGQESNQNGTEENDPTKIQGADGGDTSTGAGTTGSTNGKDTGSADNTSEATDSDTWKDNTGATNKTSAGQSDNKDNDNNNNAQSSITGDNSSANPEDVTPQGMIDQIISGEQEGLTKGDTSINVEEGSRDGINQDIIKDTGFDLTNTFLTCIAIGVLMLAAFYVTIRFNFFAHNDE